MARSKSFRRLHAEPVLPLNAVDDQCRARLVGERQQLAAERVQTRGGRPAQRGPRSRNLLLNRHDFVAPLTFGLVQSRLGLPEMLTRLFTLGGAPPGPHRVGTHADPAGASAPQVDPTIAGAIRRLPKPDAVLLSASKIFRLRGGQGPAVDQGDVHRFVSDDLCGIRPVPCGADLWRERLLSIRRAHSLHKRTARRKPPGRRLLT